jgi:sugar lactone lactonase YvrE
MTEAEIFSDTRCTLGEGALWHPERGQLFWVDIPAGRLLTREGDEERSWSFDRPVSTAGWIDAGTLLVASATDLFRLDLASGAAESVVALEADDPVTRSNDGRADPWGGFWIGTMGRNAEPGAGAIYRYYRGELRRLVGGITISNAICFAPNGAFACFCDTTARKILRWRLAEAHGWPVGEPEIYLDFAGTEWGPDGAVIDAAGAFWNAQWGAGRVARYAADGRFLAEWTLPTPQVTCPAFGGRGFTTLYVTTAAEGRDDDAAAGRTYRIETRLRGQAEHRVIL